MFLRLIVCYGGDHEPGPLRHSSGRPASLRARPLCLVAGAGQRLLKAGRLDQIDAENIAEEILDVGSNEYDKLESALRVLLMHMLKWDHQPERRSRSSENTITEQRYRANRQLRKNPSLKAELSEAVAEGYRAARLGASSETDLDVKTFPEACPYDWDTILNRPFER